MTLLFVILSFILGAALGAFVIFKQKAKIPKDIETSLKQAIDIPPPLPPKFTEAEISQKSRADTMEKRLLYEQQLSLIFKMGQEMFSSVNIENIAKVIAENANKIINAEICTFLLEDKTTGYFVPVYSLGVKPDLIDKMRFKRGESIS